MLLIAVLVPTFMLLYFMIVSALKSNDEYAFNPFGLPHHVTLAPLKASLTSGQFLGWFVTSLIVTAFSVVISTVIAALAAYPIAYMRWRASKSIVVVLIALMAVPPILLVVPLYRTVAIVGQLNTYQSAIAVYTGLSLPLSVYLLVTFYRGIPESIIEAARMDGASSLRTLVSVILPLCVPALVTIVVVQAIWIWNELLIAVIFLQDPAKQTLMVGLTKWQGRYMLQVPFLMAGMLLATVPIVLVYLAGQRFFIKGLTAGAVK